MKYISGSNISPAALLERFIKYVKTWSESSSGNAEKKIQPSTKIQFDFAKMLADELKSFGLRNVQTTEFCYTYGELAASDGFENVHPFCLLAHIDTVDEVSGKNVNPLVHKDYNGNIIELDCEVRLDPDHDEYLRLAGENKETIVTTDGTTLLGADDKAGIAAIMTFLEYLSFHDEIKHGPIEVIFSPDEETGHGMDNVPLELLKSKFAYTVDGGHIGQLETECFNAFSAKIIFHGKSAHTGAARENGMINAICMASKFIESLPSCEFPENSDGYRGFYAVIEMNGSIEKSELLLLLRDFTTEGIKKRIEVVESAAKMTASIFGGSVEISFNEQYKNMKAVIDKNKFVLEYLQEAFRLSEVVPSYTPIRGGTDGSRLTEMGIPTPNIFTGAHNLHSRSEWASVQQMCSAADILVNLALTVARTKENA